MTMNSPISSIPRPSAVGFCAETKTSTVKHSRIVTIVLLAALALLFSACSFKSPSAQEGQVLAERGAFPNSVPSWVNQNNSKNPRVSSAGYIPRGFGVPPSVASSRSRGISSAGSGRSDVREILRRAEEREEDKIGTIESTKPAGSSALDRIAYRCPQVESDVIGAIQIIDTAERIAEYENISRRCSSSSDIWFWLGRDYYSLNKLNPAKRALERSLAISPDNAAAQRILTQVRARLIK